MKAIIFPGQGSQYIGMGQSLYDNFPKAKVIFSSIDDILGFKLSEKCFRGPESELKDTAVQQLAILAVSLAAFEVILDKGFHCDYLSGLSLGEYSCLYAAEVLSLEKTVLLVKKRAQSMQEAALLSQATMFAVIGLERKTLEAEAAIQGFYLANINSPQQVVISLAQAKKENIRKALEAKGAKIIELAVSGGFHSPFMDPAKKAMEEVIKNLNFSEAKKPMVSNVTARAHIKPQEIKDNLLKQLNSTVLWSDCVGFMIKQGVDEFFEVGPGKVLKGLMHKINPQAKVVNIEKKEDAEQL